MNKEIKEFSHIEIYFVRNPKWLEQHERRGFFLSDYIPYPEDFPIPEWIKHEENIRLVSLKLKIEKQGEASK